MAHVIKRYPLIKKTDCGKQYMRYTEGFNECTATFFKTIGIFAIITWLIPVGFSQVVSKSHSNKFRKNTLSRGFVFVFLPGMNEGNCK